MEIFKWVKDIEQLYENLIEKTKEENFAEIQNLKNQQETLLEKNLAENQKFVSLALKSLSKDVDNEIKILEQNLEAAIKNLEINYQKNRKNLDKLIIEKLGFDFSV